ncbi:DUF4114 domain-containing protein [Azorhizobium doebereinerae]|uniref:DUF4114 domain-containing protein n=1 Tax=Azorhizobium doebereinerae TaxID=281091 RepID=UPI0003F61996|nr:DUF4114 domain-containing protein [Azorhizobium doebereinerae]
MSVAYQSLESATFLDLNSYGLADASLFTQLAATPSTDRAAVAAILATAFYGGAGPVSLTATDAGPSAHITVALTVDRASDPTSLLASDWATRQSQLADTSAVWATYGSDPATYAGVTASVQQLTSAAVLGATEDGTGYISTAASRTIWLSLDATQFAALFNTSLLQISSGGSELMYAWAGNLSLPSSIAGEVSGIWIDQSAYPTDPVAQYSGAVTLIAGAQGAGNGNSGGTTATNGVLPSAIAAAYNFPLAGSSVPTATIGLVEAGVSATLEQYLDAYRVAQGLAPYQSGQFTVLAGSAQTSNADPSETTLDVSILASAAPNSAQALYIYNGHTTFSAYQAAIFSNVNNTAVLSSSFTDYMSPSPNSPFASAYNDLFVDAALGNLTVTLSSGDGGSQSEYATGSPLTRFSHSVPTAIIVGGTSLSSLQTAQGDVTLTDSTQLYQNAMANDPATLFQLTASGLTALPQNLSTDTFSIFVESVWNTYVVGTSSSGAINMNPSYLANKAGTGGLSSSGVVPDYQSAFDISLDSLGTDLTSRGVPDVSILAGGNTKYEVLNSAYAGAGSGTPLTVGSGGTSAASPLWAVLTAQIDTIFADQGLPNLGYYNDLLYIAAAIAPGAFNDVTIGNNTSTFYYYAAGSGANGTNASYVVMADGSPIVPTGQGYSAVAGYDLATGLGSPNGLLLARALTAIAHTQMDQARPDVVNARDEVTALSGASQSLLVQATGALGAYALDVGGHVHAGTGDAAALAWTSRLAEQALQSDFDPALVRLLDGASQATPGTVHVAEGEAITSSVAGISLGLYQEALTTSYGFVSFGGQSEGVTLARPVAVAEMADAADDAAIVRLRQNGADSTSVMFYKVDDLSGTISGVAPGDPLYAQLAALRAYQADGGGTQIESPGYGNYAEAHLTGVHQGDIIAMALTNGGHTYWAFAQANEQVDANPVTHLWSYGLNTFGWEDVYGGGDRDYNDLLVQLDFTSLSGHGLIA